MTMLALHTLRGLLHAVPPHPSLAQRAIIHYAKKLAQRRPREIDVRLANGDDMTVRLDEFVGFHIFMEGGYEQDAIDLLCSYIRPGDCVFDIGAHMGLYTMFLARAVGGGGASPCL